MIFQSIKRLSARIMRKGLSPLVPNKVKLPFQYWLTAFEIPIDGELRYLHQIVEENGVAIDAGANIGLYSYKMSKLFSKVYAFEINEELTKDLAAYNPGNIEIINKGLSSKEGSAILYIPVLNGLQLTGWASLLPNNCPDTQEHIRKQVKICTLDLFHLEKVSLIKIDVEGHELEVLKGAIQTLTKNRPIVFIEIQQQNINQVFNFFSNLNYKQRKLEDLIGISSSEQNFIFFPVEKVS